MRPFWVAGSACALVILGAWTSPAHAAWCGVFQVTCNHCGGPPVVVQPATSLYVQRCYYEPVRPRRCGPIRRLLGRCCRPCASAPPAVAIAPPPCLPVAPPPPPMPFAPRAYVPGPEAPLPPPGSGVERNYPPQSQQPPVIGSAYRTLPQLTPPVPPRPVRLEHVVSTPTNQGVPARLASGQQPNVP